MLLKKRIDRKGGGLDALRIGALLAKEAKLADFSFQALPSIVLMNEIGDGGDDILKKNTVIEKKNTKGVLLGVTNDLCRQILKINGFDPQSRNAGIDQMLDGG